MIHELGLANIESFLERLGESLTTEQSIYLIGGSALILLGCPRITLDIDYVGDEFPSLSDQFTQQIMNIADEMQLKVEPVPLDEFIPLPENSDQRHHLIGKFDKLTAFIFDPYSIAMSKLDRGFESDLHDIAFLIEHKIISLDDLNGYMNVALKQWFEFDLNPKTCMENLEEIHKLI